MPIFSYFLIVGSVLTGLVLYADRVIAPSPLPFNVSQKIGLPEPYKAPVVVVEVRQPEVLTASVDSLPEMKTPLKTLRHKHKAVRVVRRLVPQERYAGFSTPEHGSIW